MHMKRSEMKEKIIQEINVGLSHSIAVAHIAQHVLETIEAAGMLPPAIRVDINLHWSKLTDWRNQWEPEAPGSEE